MECFILRHYVHSIGLALAMLASACASSSPLDDPLCHLLLNGYPIESDIAVGVTGELSLACFASEAPAGLRVEGSGLIGGAEEDGALEVRAEAEGEGFIVAGDGEDMVRVPYTVRPIADIGLETLYPTSGFPPLEAPYVFASSNEDYSMRLRYFGPEGRPLAGSGLLTLVGGPGTLDAGVEDVFTPNLRVPGAYDVRFATRDSDELPLRYVVVEEVPNLSLESVEDGPFVYVRVVGTDGNGRRVLVVPRWRANGQETSLFELVGFRQPRDLLVFNASDSETLVEARRGDVSVTATLAVEAPR